MESFMKNILVTGGSGLVGKHLKDILPNATYISSKDFNLTNTDDVDKQKKQNELYNRIITGEII